MQRRDLAHGFLTLAVGGAVVMGAVAPLGALGLGAAVALAIGVPAWAPSFSRHLLAVSVVALGLGVDLSEVVSAGADGFAATLVMLTLTFVVGRLLARCVGLDPDVALLITAGTAICGGSAIAAVAPLIRARATTIAASIAVVFVLNAVALVTFPVVGEQLGMDAATFGSWCALAIHDTSSVVGAAASHSRDALEVATVTKLTRMLWIVPVGFVIVRLRSGRGAQRRGPAVPWFLVAFLACTVVVSCWPSLASAGQSIASCAPFGMTMAMFAVGMCSTASLRRGLAGRALGFGVLLWAVLTLGSLAYLMI